MGVYDEYETPETQGLYFKFEDGKSYKVRLASEPLVYEETATFKGETRTSTKYAWIIYNETAKMAQVFRVPITAFKMIQEVAKNPSWGDPSMYSFMVKRTGTGLETEYSIVPDPVKCTLADIDPAAPEAVEKVELIKAISSGNGVAHVYWLADVVKAKRAGKVSMDDIADHIGDNSPSDDVVIEDIEDKPIDLSEIPF